MSDLFRFGLPLAFLIAAGAACLLFAFTPTSEPTEQMNVIPGIEADIQPAPYTTDEEPITSHA